MFYKFLLEQKKGILGIDEFDDWETGFLLNTLNESKKSNLSFDEVLEKKALNTLKINKELKGGKPSIIF